MIGNSLDDHGTPPQLTDKLLNSVTAQAKADAHMSLTGALQDAYNFIPLPIRRWCQTNYAYWAARRWENLRCR